MTNFDLLVITMPVEGQTLQYRAPTTMVTLKQGDTILRTQQTTPMRFYTWLGGILQAHDRLAPLTWMDLWSTPARLVIGHGQDRITVIHLIPEVLSWEDKIGGQTFTLPPTIVAATWKDHLLQWSGVGCLATVPSVFSADLPVYSWPFGNVYEDGHVCWGDVSTRDITLPQHIYPLAARFFGSAFNSDLRMRGWTVHPTERTVNVSALSARPLREWVR